MSTKLSVFVFLAVISQAALCAPTSETLALYSRLNTKPTDWAQLPYDKKLWNENLPAYLAYDKGSLKKHRNIAYVRVKNGAKNSKPSIYVLAAKCGSGHMASLALGETASDSGVAVALWNKGNVRFSNPYDGGDYILWRVPSGLEDVDALYAAMCG